MKYVVDIKGFNVDYKFPQQGERVHIRLESGETLKENRFGIKPEPNFVVHEVNNEGNEAGFGWVWLYNPKTNFYDYKMSIFDRRTIPGNTEVPHVGYSNLDAYHIIKCRETVRTGYALTSFFKMVYGYFFK